MKNASNMSMVTIGVCVRNAEDTIKETVESIFKQDFPSNQMEIVFVDGSSEDRTLEIIRSVVLSSNVRCRFYSEKVGLGFARQIVVGNASGKYIVWVDGDVTLPTDYVRKQVRFMEKNQRVGIAAAKHEIRADSNLVSFLEDASYLALDSRSDNSNNAQLPGTASSIYRTEAIRGVGGFDIHLTGVGEDVEAAWRVREKGWLVIRGTDAEFWEHRKNTWKGLWDHYFWYGYGTYDLTRRNSRVIQLYKMIPPAGFIAGLWYSTVFYKLRHQKRVFLFLPFHYIFKRTAWCFGFAKASLHIRNVRLDQNREPCVGNHLT